MNPAKPPKHSLGDLRQMQSLPLAAKISMTKRRIAQWCDYWDGQVYVSFSGGKDSTVLLHLARQVYDSTLSEPARGYGFYLRRDTSSKCRKRYFQSLDARRCRACAFG